MNEQIPQPVQLAYESSQDLPRAKPPAWVYVVFGIYLLLLFGFLLTPLFLTSSDSEFSERAVVIGTVVLLVGAGLGLMLTPVQLSRRRPVKKIYLWGPLLGFATLASLLILAAIMAISELATNETAVSEHFGYILISGIAVWSFWALVLWWIADAADASSLTVRFHRWLIAGSVAELLVAVPTHLVVRRRTECCAGMYTGSAIGVGVVVMFIAFGPAILMLYFKRWKKIKLPEKVNEKGRMDDR